MFSLIVEVGSALGLWLGLSALGKFYEAAYSACKKWHHTIQMANDRLVCINIDQW